MGSGSYSEIGGSVPIAAVVTGVETGKAEIGYFIVSKACTAQVGTHTVIHNCACVIIDGDYALKGTHAVKRGIFLVRETVGGYVPDREISRY
jgi:hypothetical protein